MGRIRITLPTGTGVSSKWHIAFTRLSGLSTLALTGIRARLGPSASPRGASTHPSGTEQVSIGSQFRHEDGTQGLASGGVRDLLRSLRVSNLRRGRGLHRRRGGAPVWPTLCVSVLFLALFTQVRGRVILGTSL